MDMKGGYIVYPWMWRCYRCSRDMTRDEVYNGQLALDRAFDEHEDFEGPVHCCSGRREDLDPIADSKLIEELNQESDVSGNSCEHAGNVVLCTRCVDIYIEEECEKEDPEFDDPYDIDDRMEFADPGGNSALRAATPSNPRNLPCPNCEQPNRLTPADVALGYQCDECADNAERGGP